MRIVIEMDETSRIVTNSGILPKGNSVVSTTAIEAVDAGSPPEWLLIGLQDEVNLQYSKAASYSKENNAYDGGEAPNY